MEVLRYRMQLVKESAVEYGKRLESPEEMFRFAIDVLEMQKCDREMIVAVAMNVKLELLGYSIISIGTANSAPSEPRDILKFALGCNAMCIVLMHNHVSGDPTPSKDDEAITLRLNSACDLLGIDLIDHIVVGHETYVSLKEKGVF